MKTAIYSLYQRHELAKVRCFIAQVLPILNDRCQLHILINDYDCPDLRRHVNAVSPHITIHWVGSNLGVAGGRNLLVRRAIEAGAEFLISCDTDIIYETSYFDRLRDAYAQLSKTDPNLGFLQPVLLDGRGVRGCFSALRESTDWDVLYQRLSTDASWRQDFWGTVSSALNVEQALGAIYHSGISNLWRAHFGATPDKGMFSPWSRQEWQGTYLTADPTLRSNLPQLEKVISDGGPVRVMSTAGGVTAFHKSVFEGLGGYDDIFNPFGYEDSEMGFRSTMAGRNNYLIPSVFAIHDIFMGETNRQMMSYSRLGLLRGVELTHPNLAGEDFNFAFQQSVLFCWRDLLKLFSDEIGSGRMSLSDATQRFPDFALSYAFDLVRGMLHGLAQRDNYQEQPPCLGLLRGFLDGGSEVVDFYMPLGLGARLVAGRALARRRLGGSGLTIYSLFASNCRVEETTEAGTLCSRYFDLACVIHPAGEQLYQVTADIQADDQAFGIELVVEFNPERAHTHGSAKLVRSRVTEKRYDFGQFSVEDIYPPPTLDRSKKWLPMMRAYIDRIDKTLMLPNVREGMQLVMRYLRLTQEEGRPAMPSPCVDETRKKRILVFADSRGQHKPAGGQYPIFGERLAADARLEVDLFLCPMKWTTTLDFLERFDSKRLANYDHVILYTGIVDWSPRKLSNAVGDLYDNPSSLNPENLSLNTRDYSKKIVNSKKRIFDEVFGVAAMSSHFAEPLETLYEGELTANMYSLEMARDSLLPRLNAIPNLIFISANRFVSGWNGDYKRQRPANINLSHAYSDLFSEKLTNAKIIDLRCWADEEVKIYTCDNLHLTQQGSDYIYGRLMEAMGLAPVQQIPGPDNQKTVENVLPLMAKGFPSMHSPERMRDPEKKAKVLAAAKRRDFLATLVIGLRLNPQDEVRSNNLKFLLKWLDYYYGDLFDILLIEQDSVSRLDLKDFTTAPNVRHEFIYNPEEYNRGWGYNVAVAHFCESADVVALMDTDVLTGKNFVREIIDCHSKYDAISPYQNIYYTDANEVAEIRQTNRLEGLVDTSRIKNPVTVAGGIFIVKRSVFIGLKGFEQYVGYGCEDRALDVTLYNHLDRSRIRIAEGAYAHLYHQSDAMARSRFDEIYEHLVSNYGCKYDKRLGPFDFIHSNCDHVPVSVTQKLIKERSVDFGDVNLYLYNRKMTVNGIVNGSPEIINKSNMDNIIYPPEFTTLEAYPAKELYANTPEPDSAEFAALYNAFKGKRCFIIGNGPSLNEHDLSLLKDEYTFGVNSFFYKTRESGFKPYFYVVEDSSVMKENIEEIRRFDTPYKFFPTNYKNLHPKQPNTLFFRMNRGFYEKSSPNYVVPRFSTDASKVLYCGQSVTYINLQLAYFMGFSEVYLIGMDFSYVIPRSHKRTGDVLLSDSDDPNHFHKDYFGKGKTWKDPKLDRVALNYKQAKLVYEATGRKIYNATIGGALEIFERVDYNALLTRSSARSADATSGDGAFAEANRLLVQGMYSQALSIYVQLAKSDYEFFVYKRAALDCYLRAVEKEMPCGVDDVAYVRGLIVGLP